MKLNAYSIYDRKALQYHPPFFTHTDGAAVRDFKDLANDPATRIGRHPADFVLFLVGIFDDSKGTIETFTPITHVADAQALVAAQAIQAEFFKDAAQ